MWICMKDAYFRVPIHKEDRTFLKFSFKEKTYQFKCLPFGLACTPQVFTKTLKPVTAQLGQLGMHLMVYTDNTLILAESKELARDHVIGLFYIFTGEPRLCDKQAQVCSRANTIDGVPRFLSELSLAWLQPESCPSYILVRVG